MIATIICWTGNKNDLRWSIGRSFSGECRTSGENIIYPGERQAVYYRFTKNRLPDRFDLEDHAGCDHPGGWIRKRRHKIHSKNVGNNWDHLFHPAAGKETGNIVCREWSIER